MLGHIHDDETDTILREIPEVALVVAGHDHKGYTEMKHYAGRFAVEARSYGVEVGRVDLKYDPQARKASSAEWTRIPVDAKKVAPVQDVAELVAKWEVEGLQDGGRSHRRSPPPHGEARSSQAGGRGDG